MAKLKIRGRELRKLGFPTGGISTLALNLVKKHYKHGSKEEVLDMLSKVIRDPEKYLDHAVFEPIAQRLVVDESRKGARVCGQAEGV